MRLRSSAAAVLVGSLLACLLPAPPAVAASAPPRDLCLIPETPAPGPGATLRVGLHDSALFPGDPIDWRPGTAREFFLFDARGRLDLNDRAPEGTPLMPRVPLRSPGSTIVALVTGPSYIEMEARDFQQSLKREGHDDILEMRTRMGQSQARGRTRDRRYVKTIVDTGGDGSDVALARLDLTIEIVPETRPDLVRPGGTLPVRVLFEGAPYAGGLLCSARAGDPSKYHTYAWCGRLDDAGRASVPIVSTGWQLVRTTRMRALAGDERADWASYGAALTFAVPPNGPTSRASASKTGPR